MSQIKRLNYFNNQFLDERDFKDEQNYHITMRRLHNRVLHSWGIADGLEVRRHGDTEVQIKPGMALDVEGREIWVQEPVNKELTEGGPNEYLWLTLSLQEVFAEEDHQTPKGAEGYTRLTEQPAIAVERNRPDYEGAIILASVRLDGRGHIGDIDASVRKYAASDIAPGSVRSESLADNVVTTHKLADRAVTEHKLDPDLRLKLSARRGWVRVTFKPAPLEDVLFKDTVTGRVVDRKGSDIEDQFIPEVCSARSTTKGARGSLSIPVPAGATRIHNLRIYGHTAGTVDVELWKSGWNESRREPEATQIVEFTVEGARGGNFDRQHPVNQPLRDDESLAVKVVARRDSHIWFVAAEFE